MKHLALVALLTGTALAGGREATTAPPTRPLTAYAELSRAEGAAFDRAFLRWLPGYLEVAQRIANSTVHGGTNTHVKILAGQAKTTYSASIAKLRSWGGNPSAIFDIAGPLNNDYDHWFLTAVPRQNDQLRQLLRLVPSHTRNADLRQFATDLLTQLDTQEAHTRTLLNTLK